MMKGIIGIGALVVLFLGFWIAWSYFEARSFERITGQHVSTFDAMFVELRVAPTGE